jgi:PAS domain S-box-containing protein
VGTDSTEPLHDPARLDALRQSFLLDTPAEAEFDRLARLVTRVLHVPVSLVSLVAEDRQFFIGCAGLPEPWASARQTPLTHSFCRHVVNRGGPFVVTDARDHPLVKDNRAVADLNVVAYAGVPLVTAGGFALGSLCAIDHKPREWTDDEVGILHDLAASVMAEAGLLAAARKARLDEQERDRLAAQVRAEQSRFEQVIRQMPVGVFIAEAPAGRLVLVNDQVERILRHPYMPAADVGQYSKYKAVHPDGRPYLSEEYPLARSLRDGEVVTDEEMEYERGDGTRCFLRVSSAPIRDPEGGVVASVVTFYDITARKRAEADERRVREALARDALLLTNVRDSVIATDLEGVVTFWNEGATRLFGLSADEMVGRPVVERLPEQSRNEASDWIKQAAAGRAECDGEWLDYRRDGSRVWVEGNTRRITDAAGRVIGLMGVSHDISERKRAEEALQRRTRSLRMLADTSVRLLTEDDPAALVEGLFRQLGEHLGLEVFLNYLVTPDDQRLRLAGCGGVEDRLRPSLEYLDFGESVCGTVALKQTSIVVEDVQHSPDPKTELVRQLGVTAYACHPLLAHGRLIGTLSYGSRSRTRFDPDDLDLMRAASDQVAMALDRKRLTEELRYRADELAQANAAKDRLLAVLSHDLRNPLTPVLISAGVMEADPKLPPEFLPDVQAIRQNVELEVRLIDDLLDITRVSHGKLELHTEVVDVHTLLARTLEVCRGDLHDKGLRLVQDLRAGRHHAEADPARLQQVLWNVVKNAAKFTPPGGRVTVATGDGPGGTLRIDVADTGTGIEPAHLPIIFNAFEQGDRETTRRLGGLGLGLSIAKALVEMHGGTITARSEGWGRGATFTITLPTTDRPDEPSSPPVRSAALAGAGGQPCLKILLVDDQESIVRSMTRLLRTMCHEVTSAGTVAAAVERATAERFDLLICDLGLPDGSGLEVMRRLKPRYPIKGIAMTGYGMDEDIRQSRAAGFDHFLIKPVPLDRLEGAIRDLAR